MPKFSFPIPGRKSHKSTRDVERQSTYAAKSPVSPTVSTSSGLSKAQRFFGTDNDLNIDSPTRDDDSWMVPSSRSSVMSISISESTQMTGQSEDIGNVYGEDKWDTESGVFPNRPAIETRASSTILGARYGEATYSITEATARLRNEDSSSTLKSFYDRHNSPLAISQQTSESSSRDLALRKGLPKVIPASPLLHVQSVESLFLDSIIGGQQADHSQEKGSRKKPAKLDLSMLFPGSGRRTSKSTAQTPNALSPASRLQATPDSFRDGPNKLRKAFSKDSLRSQRSTTSSMRRSTLQTAAPNQQPQIFIPSPINRSPMDQIPEHLIPERRSTLRPPQRPARPDDSPVERPTSSSQKNASRSTDSEFVLPTRPWDKSSAASISSQNTRSSNKTASSSALSNIDLQHNSILSLSDSEDEDDNVGDLLTPPTSSTDKISRLLDGTIPTIGTLANSSGTDNPSHNKSAQAAQRRLSTRMRRTLDQFPSIPETSLPHRVSTGQSNIGNDSTDPHTAPHLQRQQTSETAIDGQSTMVDRLALPKDVRHSVAERKTSRRISSSQKGHARKSSQKSQRSTQQPTPPLSPSSMEFRVDPEDSNRFMAVTKQEEALLAALRQKRAKMKEEHDVVYRSPPRTAEEIKTARYSNVPYRNSMGPSKETVLMYLDTPIAEAQRIYTAEPSPDLSDFFGYISDEESTPRNSWKQPRTPGAPRPDSTISPRNEKLNAPTASSARLSAVGVLEDYVETKSTKSSGSKTKPNSVRFSKDVKQASAGDSDEEPVWGL